MGALHELEEAYNSAKADPSFIGTLPSLFCITPV